jgi:hypothetical protein
MQVDELHEGVGGSLSCAQAHPPAEQRRLGAATRLASFAAAARHAADDLGDEFPQAARHFDNTAAGFEHLAKLLRDPHLDDVLTLTANLGRYQAVAVAAGALLIALGVSRLMRSSGEWAGRHAGGVSAVAEGADDYGVH